MNNFENTINLGVRFPVPVSKETIDLLIGEIGYKLEAILLYGGDVNLDCINVKVVDLFCELKKIDGLLIKTYLKYEDKYIMKMKLLDSVIALINTQAGREDVRKEVIEFGFLKCEKLYDTLPLNHDSLMYRAYLFHWLKFNEPIIASGNIYQYDLYQNMEQSKIIKLSPSENDIINFYNTNKKSIYSFMIDEMKSKHLPDSFYEIEAVNYYHYYQTLSNAGSAHKSEKKID